MPINYLVAKRRLFKPLLMKKLQKEVWATGLSIPFTHPGEIKETTISGLQL